MCCEAFRWYCDYSKLLIFSYYIVSIYILVYFSIYTGKIDNNYCTNTTSILNYEIYDYSLSVLIIQIICMLTNLFGIVNIPNTTKTIIKLIIYILCNQFFCLCLWIGVLVKCTTFDILFLYCLSIFMYIFVFVISMIVINKYF